MKIIDITKEDIWRVLKLIFATGPAKYGSGILVLLYSPSILPAILGYFGIPVSDETTPENIQYILTLFAIWLMVLPVYKDIKDRQHIKKENERKLVIGIQIDAYNNTPRPSMEATVPANVRGKRIPPIMLDKYQELLGSDRQKLTKVATDILNLQHNTIKALSSGHNPDDIEVYVGGLAPVPFLFLLGNALEDERPIHWVEYDRVKKKWAWSHEGEHIDIWGYKLPNALSGSEVVIKAGITYTISDNDIEQVFPSIPVIVWEPANKLLQKVIDEESCIEITNEFKALIVELHALGINKINLLLACSSALTMRLGSVVDPRNMPLIIVYQYEKEDPLIYPWSL